MPTIKLPHTKPGHIRATPVRNATALGFIDLPTPFQVPAIGTIELEPTNEKWCWKLETVIYGVDDTTEYVNVPTRDTAYNDLIRSDPGTFTPSNYHPEPAWWAALRNGLQGAAPGERGKDGVNGKDGKAGRDGFPGQPGPQGKPGPNTVPTQNAVAEYLSEPGNPVNVALARAIADDRTVSDAAANAVSNELVNVQVVRSVDANPVDDAVGGTLDDNDRLTWLTFNAMGGPTDYSQKWIKSITKTTPTNKHDMLVNEMRVQNGGTIRTNGAAPVVFICDHGLINFRDIILPLLNARGLPSVMALNGNLHKPGYNIEVESKTVTWAEVDSWGSVEIANHGASHTTVALTDSQLEAEIVGSLNDLKTNLPSKRILHWVQPAINYPGFSDGLKTDNWTDTQAGKLIYENHAVMTGTMKTPTHPLIPRDGNPVQGMVGIWIDSLGSTTTVKQQISAAAAAGKGIIIRHHPRTINSSATTITTAELTSFFDFLKAEQDASRIRVMNLSQWSIADTGK